MALIKCNVCGEMVNDTETVCPRCGAPMQAAQNEENQNEETPAEETAEFAEEGSATSHKKHSIIIAAIAAVVLLAVAAILIFKPFSQYKGFKKDRATGIYYQFYGDIHDTADMPKTGDLVGIVFSLRAGDSVLIPMMPNEMLMDSLYKGDLYAALRMMHVGDSATFIFDGPEFFENFMQTKEYPFGDDPLYADIKLYGVMPHDQFVKMQAQYEEMTKEAQNKELETITKYLEDNKLNIKPTEEGIYYKTIKKGSGEQPQNGQTVSVHYTGSFLDGTLFDSSIERGEPFQFTLGSGQVIPGWDIALSKMHVGEKAMVIIPSNLAYGPGNQYIPPYSPLHFEIELLSIQ